MGFGGTTYSTKDSNGEMVTIEPYNGVDVTVLLYGLRFLFMGTGGERFRDILVTRLPPHPHTPGVATSAPPSTPSAHSLHPPDQLDVRPHLQLRLSSTFIS